MAVIVATKTELRCKICSSAHRQEVDTLILKRSERLLNLADVLARMLDMGFVNPTKENITLHLRKHCRILQDENVDKPQEQLVGEEMGEAALALALAEFGPGWQDRVLTNDEFLTFTRIAAQHDLILRMKQGEKTGVTIDQGLKAVDAGTRRKSSEATDEMRKGIGMALQSVYGMPALPPGEPTIIEHEPIEEGEIDELDS